MNKPRSYRGERVKGRSPGDEATRRKPSQGIEDVRKPECELGGHMAMTEIDDMIGQVENLYRSITGKAAPPADTPYASIPAEKDPVVYVQEQMDRLFGLLGDSTIAALRASFLPTWTPPVSVLESAAEVLVSVDLPGIPRDRTEVRVESGILLISAQRSPPQVNGHRLRASERAFGTFRRAIPLPAGVRVQDMTAASKDGVLEIRIPREVTTGKSPTVPVS